MILIAIFYETFHSSCGGLFYLFIQFNDSFTLLLSRLLKLQQKIHWQSEISMRIIWWIPSNEQKIGEIILYIKILSNSNHCVLEIQILYLYRRNRDDLRIIGAISIDLTGVLNENEGNHLDNKEVKKRVMNNFPWKLLKKFIFFNFICFFFWTKRQRLNRLSKNFAQIQRCTVFDTLPNENVIGLKGDEKKFPKHLEVPFWLDAPSASGANRVGARFCTWLLFAWIRSNSIRFYVRSEPFF